jgi:hypothetical protein
MVCKTITIPDNGNGNSGDNGDNGDQKVDTRKYIIAGAALAGIGLLASR